MSYLFHFDDYAYEAEQTAVFPEEKALEYLSLGLVNEAGEVAGKVKKYFRGDYDHEELKDRIKGELGDVLWYLAMLTSYLDIRFSDVATDNLAKLSKRKEAGTLKGDGDTR